MFYNKKILALIPARGGSKGIRLKNLKKINNVSLIEHTANFIKKCNFFDETIVSTDSIKISNHAKKLQFQIFKRSKFTSKDHASDFDVISEVLKNKNTLKKKFDYIVYLQPTSPIRKISQLKNALYYLIRKNYDSSWSISKVDKKFHPKKILRLVNKKFIYIYENDGKKVFARQQLEDVYIRNGIFYIFKISKILKAKNIYLKKNYASITNYSHINIDTPEDLKKARMIFK